MKKITKTLCMLFIACMSAIYLQAQTDVTTTYLQNADFETAPTFTENNGTANGNKVGNGYEIANWTTASQEAYNRSATAKYGITFNPIPDVLNGVNPPTSDINGKTEGAMLMISGSWGSTTQLTQTVTLPAGKYELVFDVLNQNPGKSIANNCFGFIPDNGTPIYGTTITFSEQWKTEKITFSLNEETSGKISIGIKGANAGASSNGKLAIDNIKLLHYAADKSGLQTKIAEATDVIVAGSVGSAYMNSAISVATEIYNNNNASVEQILQAIEDLETAIRIYKDKSLSDLKVNGTTIKNFNSEVFNYVYYIKADDSIPSVSVTATGSISGAQAVVTPSQNIPGTTIITVTAGNGEQLEYTVNFIISYMIGWDADGATDKTPGDAGWLSTNSSDWLQIDAGQHCYRDNITIDSYSGRTLTTDYGDFIYSYPIQLTGGKIYQFTGRIGAINGGSNPASFNIDMNTAADRVDGISLVSRIYSIKQSTLNTYPTISFYVPTTGTYYFTFQSTTGTRGLLANLVLIELPVISASNLSTFSDGAFAGIQELVLEGDFTAENITTLNAKLGANSILTSIDLTKATVAADADDIFAALNPNTLKYFAEGSSVPADWTNAVIGNTATAIVLTDGYSFHNSKAFTASAISYKRAFAKGWSTFSLPFAIADITELGTIEKYMEMKENTIVFDAATEIMAGNPYLISVENEAEKTFSASNAEVPVTVAEAGIFNATFRELTGAKAEGKLILVDEGETQKFETATAEATIPAFRAYISIENPSSQRFSVEHKSNGPNAIEKINTNQSDVIVYSSADGKITIETTTAQYIRINSIDGRLLQSVSLAEGESITINGLAAGIYLVNNRKVAIK